MDFSPYDITKAQEYSQMAILSHLAINGAFVRAGSYTKMAALTTNATNNARQLTIAAIAASDSSISSACFAATVVVTATQTRTIITSSGRIPV